MYYVDLNSDLGESFGNYTIGMDAEILKYVSSANVACGWHAGDPIVMEKTVAVAKDNGVAVGSGGSKGVCEVSAGGFKSIYRQPRCENSACKTARGSL